MLEKQELIKNQQPEPEEEQVDAEMPDGEMESKISGEDLDETEFIEADDFTNALQTESDENNTLPGKAEPTELISDSDITATDAENITEIQQQNIDIISAKQYERINYRYSTEDEIGLGGLKTKFKNNVDAIKTLKVIESETGWQLLQNRESLQDTPAGAACLRFLIRTLQAGKKSIPS
jgi:hypothetical protein